MSKKHLPAPEDLLPLSPTLFHLLLALSDGERHGYALNGENERRRYYRITPFGRQVAQAEAVRMRELVRIADDAFGLPERA